MKDSVKDESKTSIDDKPKNDGSIVGIPESKEVDKKLKVNTGGSKIDTPQKTQVVNESPQNQKGQEVLAKKDQFLGHCKGVKKALLLLRGQRERRICVNFLALIRNN